MEGTQGIESLAAGDGRHHLSRSLGPALLISVGYIDLGKWVATVDAGARFGYDLVLLVLLFNFSAVLCQYMSTCIGMVTGKNLAEISREEYSQSICVGLGLQAGLSLFASEVTMISGIAVGFDLVFEHDDLITGIIFASVVVNVLPYVLNPRDKRMGGTLIACIAGFAILCFVLGLLLSQPEIPLHVNVIFPKLSGESAYSLMALLGANIIAHNFYVHSSVVQDEEVVQVQRRSPVPTLGALFHDHLFSILFIFTGVFLVNYVLLSSAAVESSNHVILTFHDAVELMSQIFSNPMAPLVLLAILLFSSHIISLTSVIASHVVTKNFFGANLPLSAHHVLLKVLAMIPTIYCAKVASSEGIYQLLILCPVIQAMLLPSSVIPVFRVASSRSIMGNYRISLYVEILAFLAFLLMLFTNIIFAAEILFGDSTWTNNLKGNTESPVVLPHTVVVLMSCASIAFTLFLAVTPLKSASNEAETDELSVHRQREALDTTHHREDTSLEYAAHEEIQRYSTDAVPRDSLESHQKSTLEHTDSSDTTAESDHGTQHSSTYTAAIPEAHPLTSINREESKSLVGVDFTEPSMTEKDVEVEADVCTYKDNETSHNLKFEKSTGSKAPSLSSSDPPSLTMGRDKDTDAGNGSGSLSRLPGLGRAARRQLAAILDEFWGHLFDCHGKLTHEANAEKFNFLLGLDLRMDSSAVRTDKQNIEASKSPLMRDAVRGSGTLRNSWDSVSHSKEISSPDLTFGLQMGAMESSTWSQGMCLPNMDILSSSSTLLDQNAKLHSNFNVSPYSDNQFYQPATIHGYQLADYLKGINACRSPHSSIPLDPRRPPISSESAGPNYADSVMHARNQNMLGSLGYTSLQSPTMNHLSTMTLEKSYYDPTVVDVSESGASSAYSKKYHSSPDISALIAASRNLLLNKANLGSAAGDQSYLSRLATQRSHYVDTATRFQRDVLMNTNPKSLWSQQPFEQLCGVSSAELNRSEVNTEQRSSGTKDDFSYTECEAKLLLSLGFCIRKLLKLEGSEWLFRQNGGCDENLIDQVAVAERVSQETADDRDANCKRRPLNCGGDCVWQASLVISFGVWCIHRVLDLSLLESRPELWGKYTYVLNRLQGILDPAFSKPRKPVTGCTCLEKTCLVAKPISVPFTTAAVILEVIKDVEQAISGRKGRSSTAAGDVAFPKGKENLASVLRRYKRRLSSKSPAGK